MSEKWTPGPWRARHDEANDYVVEWDYLDHNVNATLAIATVHGSAGPADNEQNARENAALIAAAPELYDALQYITRWLMTDVDALPPHVTRDDVRIYHLDGAVLHNCLERARAALARAKGETADE